MKRFLIAIIAVCTVILSFAQNIPDPMSPARLVNDFAGLFTSSQIDALETKLVDFDRTTSNQIAVVTVNDLDGMAVSDYGVRLFEKWKIGGTKKDNGILILIKPKTQSENGRVSINVGYGLEGAVPDILAGRIVDYDMIPYFEKNDYYGGVAAAVNTLIGLTEGEFTADEYLKRHKRAEALSVIFSVLIFMLAVFLLSLRRRKGHTVGSGNRSVPPTIFIGGVPFMGRGRGGFGGFSGGGGFGGFGGGMTGGGGASGSW
ncbi:MAG: TPM domain-containing protein [Rikenellaceae bacterium]|nr:TPM domain-containing protein [Rikenellaceae bacterium]